MIPSEFSGEPDQTEPISVTEADLVVVTQSCDLEDRSARTVVCARYYSLSAFEEENPDYGKKGLWENVRKGRVEGLHLFVSPESPEDPLKALVVDFRAIDALPLEYLERRADEIGTRWRMNSPYREHFSQAFARFFMRVGLPVPVPRFSGKV